MTFIALVYHTTHTPCIITCVFGVTTHIHFKLHVNLFQETIGALNFGSRAMKVQTSAVRNVREDYRTQCLTLQAKLDAAENRIRNLEQNVLDSETEISELRVRLRRNSDMGPSDSTLMDGIGCTMVDTDSTDSGSGGSSDDDDTDGEGMDGVGAMGAAMVGGVGGSGKGKGMQGRRLSFRQKMVSALKTLKSL